MSEKRSIIIKFDHPSEQTVGNVTKIVGLVEARYFVAIMSTEIDNVSKIIKH